MDKNKHSYGLLQQTMYGMGEFFNGGAFVIINTFFAAFMTKALGMPAFLAGTIPLVGKIWDAITDPIMGNITDRTKSKLGAKRFYMLIGAFLSSLSFILLWIPINTDNTILLYIFYLLMYCIFSTGFTVLMVPYNGLLPDMIDDYSLRSKFSNMRMIWSTLGSMVCGLVPTLIITDPRDKSLYIKCAVIFGALFLFTSLMTFFGTWEREKEVVHSNLSDSFSQALSVFRCRSFKLFIGIYLAGQCGMDFVSGMAVYYVDDVLRGYENHYITYLMGVLVVSQLIGMLIWGPVMTKTSKKTTLLIGAPIRIISTLGLLFFSYEGSPIVCVLILTAGIGIGNAATLTSIFAIMADMADVDELITSIRRPGTVSGMATFARKVSAGVSAGMIGLLLSLVGYDSNLAKLGKMQSAFTRNGISLIFVLLPVILVALLIYFGYKFPMKQYEFSVIKKEIARRSDLDFSDITPEEIAICEKVTGMKYDDLWNPKNAKIGGKNR
ncbi:MAG: MFS transporter [Lachnospiraceae bacterium]|nr:MFS transporter [Lachnospiraceae bacterium]